MIFEHDAAYWGEDAKLEFAVTVEHRMHQLDLSRKDLAKRMGNSPAYVTKILRGDSNPTIESMARIAHALNARLHLHIAAESSGVRWFESIPSRNETKNIGTLWAKSASNPAAETQYDHHSTATVQHAL